ncbi:2-hydroxyacyl-CoA dehydratase subunit D [Acetobacterium bakii]|uniref:Benzoyl-CoA reductase n=1 Tax=Acetobacterium bakii TaxID=52689 RepID=A0A0L6TZE2_9FIRM|nr:2-hydroxyacyl-CoA dehydratase family protein [Acetobacterium bakii]KNZ41618.1 benzoyl-CoA reductase [Acetobacterium bakii]
MSNLKEKLQAFHEIASSPKEQLKKYLEQNKKVVICAPVYTPEEIVHAMGIIPFGTWGADIEIKEAKTYFPAFICSVMQSVLELGIRGDFDGASAIIIPSLCDSLKCLGENWKSSVENIPFIPMVYPQNRKADFGKAFTKAGYERVIADLEKATGLSFDDAKLTESIEIYNEHNAVMRQLSDCLSDYPEITAADRSAIFKSAFYLEKSEHTALVKGLLSELTNTEKTANNKIKIVTTGILADAADLLKIFDDNNMQIVADNVAGESRQYQVDAKPAETSLDSLAGKFAEMDNCSVLFNVDKAIAQYTVDLVAKYQARGVIFVMTKFCDPEEFDYVIIKKACAEKNIPLLLIEIDRQMTNYEQVRTAVETFKEILK